MIQDLIAAIIAIGISTLGYLSGAQPVYSPAPTASLGAFDDPFISLQLATDPDSGECLTTDGTNNEWSTSCGSGGGGSKWATSTDDVSIYPAGATKVGIGSTTPTSQLSIQGAGIVGIDIGTITNTGDRRPFINFINGNNGGSDPCFLINAFTATTTNNPLALRCTTGTTGATASFTIENAAAGVLTERFRVHSDGNIGVGTTSPYAKLSVAGQVVGAYFTATSSTASTFASKVGVGTTTPSATLDVYNTSGVALNVEGGAGGVDIAQFRRRTGANSFFGISGAGGDSHNYYTSAANVSWAVGVDNSAGDKFTISQSTGLGTNDAFTIDDLTLNVGISTTSPFRKLSVNGNAHITSYLGVGSTSPFAPLANIPFEVWYNADSYMGMVIGNANGGATASTDLIWNNNLTNSSGTSYYADCGLNSSNYSGATAINVANGFYCYNQDGPVTLSVATTSTSGYIALATNGHTERLRLGSNGGVSIGTTTTATSLFQTSGYIWRQDTALNGVGSIRFYEAQVPCGGLDYNHSTDIVSIGDFFSGCGNQSLQFHTADTIRMMIDTSGRVGIGTTSPNTKVHIESTGTATTLGQLDTNLRLGTNTVTLNAGNEISFRGINTATPATATYAAVSAIVTSNGPTGTQGHLVFSTKASVAATSLTETMRITSGQLVGIGTSTPPGKLTVQGNGTGSGVALSTADSNGVTRFSVTDAGSMTVGAVMSSAASYFSSTLVIGSASVTPSGLANSGVDVRSASTNALLNVGALYNPNTGANSGVGLTFGLFDTGGGSDRAATIVANKLSPWTAGDEDGRLNIMVANNGTLATSTVFTSTGLGVGTTTPESSVDVGTKGDGVRQYLQIDSEAGAPDAGDCDSLSEAGRMIIDHTNDVMYVCNQYSGRGWDTMTLTD